LTAEKRPVTSRDLWSLRFVGDPELSPSAKDLVWVETWIDAKKNHYESAVYIARRGEDGSFGTPARLTYGKRQDGDGAMDRTPRFSPDGTLLAFTSNRSGKNQIWVLNVKEGGEARELTKGDESPSQTEWSPNGKYLAFVAREPKPKEEKKDDEIRTGKDFTVITHLRYKSNGVSGVVDPRPTHIYVSEVATGAVRQLTSGDFNDSGPVFSLDGKLVAFSSCREPGRETNMIHPDLWLIPFEGGEATKLTRGRGPVHDPVYSPDGNWIAFLGHTNGLDTTSNVEVLVIGKDGGELRHLWNGFDRGVGNGAGTDSRMDTGRSGPFWSEDSRSLYFILGDRGYSGVYRVSLDSPGPELVAGSVPGNVQACPKYPPVVNSLAVAFSDGKAVFAFNGCSTLNPNDIYVVTMPFDACGSSPKADGTAAACALQQVTRVNEELLSGLKLSKPELFTFKSTDGLVLDGWMMKPIDFEQGKKYPAVVEVHGGPHSAYGEAFFLEFQLLSSRGFGVFYCNPRGSSCYGKKFADGVIGDWGGMDYQDVMSLRDYISKVDWVDDSKAGITGGSYGGYMTNWVVGHTDDFAAAVACRSISNMYSKYGVADNGWFGNKAGFAGRDLWDSEDFIMERSPIRYAPNVKTPLLLFHSEQDYRCPIEQAEQFYMALKRLGKTVEFVRCAGENHELSRSGKPWNRVERLDTIMRAQDSLCILIRILPINLLGKPLCDTKESARG